MGALIEREFWSGEATGGSIRHALTTALAREYERFADGPVDRAWRRQESDYDIPGWFLAKSLDRCCSAEVVQARVETIESTYEALIGRSGSAGFDPGPFKARLRSIAAARTAALGEAEAAKGARPPGTRDPAAGG